MLENKLKRKLQAGEAAFGLGLRFPITIPMLRILHYGKVDWLFIDIEHGSGDISQLFNIVQVADMLDMNSVARIPALEYHWLSRSLDTGALNVMIPRVETREQAERAVLWARFAPQGTRGCGSPSHLCYAPLGAAQTVEILNRETMVVLQIESEAAIDSLEDIASVPGVDALFIGPMDMSLSVGRPGDVTNEVSRKYFREICRVAQDYELAVGIVCAPDQVDVYYSMGVRMFSIGTVLDFIRTGVQTAAEEFHRRLDGK
jgi:2-keto-3-deoxy-L-rhamnonate aldolase RhmA